MLTLKAQTKQSILLNDNWQFTSATILVPPNATVLGQKINQDGYKTNLPNTILKVLCDNKAIEEPVSSANTSRLQWLDAKDWVFERYFDLDKHTLEAQKIELELTGIQTYAGVFVNDYLVLKTTDDRSVWSAEIKSLLKMHRRILFSLCRRSQISSLLMLTECSLVKRLIINRMMN